MIKTLRITSIVAVVLAVAFFAFPAVFGVRGDDQAEQFIDIRTRFEKIRGQRSAKGRSQVSPLVKEAAGFASYLNPQPKATTKKTTPADRPPTIVPTRPSGPVSTKFTLIGTTYFASNPELSLALIDEPGKGLHWVRQSGKVGHLIIEQVKDGLVVVRDGERTSELMPERPPKISLLKGEGALSGRTGPKPTLPSSIGPKATLPPSVGPKTASRVPPKAASSIRSNRPPRMSPEEMKAMEKLMSELNSARQPGKTGSGRSGEETAALMGKLISELKTSRISAEEAKRLDDLGKELKGTTEYPNRPRSRKIEKSKTSREPNSPPKK